MNYYVLRGCRSQHAFLNRMCAAFPTSGFDILYSDYVPNSPDYVHLLEVAFPSDEIRGIFEAQYPERTICI